MIYGTPNRVPEEVESANTFLLDNVKILWENF
jgi:hypothetical protein